MSFLKFKKVWLKKVFAGYGTEPTQVKSVTEIITFISFTPGAIGVVPLWTEAEGCKKHDCQALTFITAGMPLTFVNRKKRINCGLLSGGVEGSK